MNIWIIDHYAVPPKYYPLARQTIFARKLNEKGHTTTIFCASTVHNSDINLNNGDKLYREEIVNGVRYVYISCKNYKGNGIKRIFNMLEFARKLPKVCKKFEKPDAVLACSMTLQACKQGIRLAKKYKVKAVAQITDLWPETIVAYGAARANNPAVVYLRKIEKWIYIHADEIIFSMEGAYEYIKERKWEKYVSENKVHFINNGVDLEAFDYNKTHYLVEDEDLNNPDNIKVVYVGSIRRVNNLGILLDIAKNVNNDRIKFLIWGDGDEKETLEKRLSEENIKNVFFKGRVEKKYIPYISSKADYNFLHCYESPIFRFGISMNKLFDYFAAGKPIICDFKSEYNPAVMTNSCILMTGITEMEKADSLVKALNDNHDDLAYNARKAAENKYNFEILASRLNEIMEG